MQKPGKPEPRSLLVDQPVIASDRIPARDRTKPITEEELWTLLDEVKDPEVPAVSVVELGIVRRIAEEDGEWVVDVTPTYSGCPATEMIEQSIVEALQLAGVRNGRIRRVLTPAWTTDWITDTGREKLREFGIAPPQGSASKLSLTGMDETVICPICGSEDTQRVSEFGSTACKALYRCLDCHEPFDYFKCI
ncbi:ring-1,2-phenylacetyl-CoA epoxidase subunit PaaD [Marinobacter daqiaonensis]|uniref:Ring-1,2-phenylacetyl-CoA epoxidase subunit PaaD n=1 Tax=Marinobacter daqiaonensis TaxID=650891 RepID=A0A1I6J1W9_9GAMM|nr:1,2-phenylacetyl-CoA epoxidase subunit PaaD [Marinobacter daqiaonensis]SFR72992.1 ring-1,2-phenylacetyl-CoA epoxidase subunit PaaD [Marinobacter daqiaonensis]